MTQCPKCNRTYTEDFAFCLDDGTPLKPSTAYQATVVNPETPPPTLVMPPPETQQPPPGSANTPPIPTPTGPPSSPKRAIPKVSETKPQTAPTARQNISPATTFEPAKSGRPIVAVVIGVLVIVVVLIGVGAVGVWLLNQGLGQNQNQSSAANQNSPSSSSSVTAANPNPGATTISLSDLANQSASPTTVGDAPGAEKIITPGIYHSELTRKIGEGNKVTVVLRIRIAVNVDGTYVSRGYMTVPQANIHDQLGIEEKGNYSQSGDTLNLTNRKEREFDFDTGSWKGWTTPDDGSESHEKVRNVTPSTFQLFDDETKRWYSFSKE
jgi:cytoskeletal protein RodZ